MHGRNQTGKVWKAEMVLHTNAEQSRIGRDSLYWAGGPQASIHPTTAHCLSTAGTGKHCKGDPNTCAYATVMKEDYKTQFCWVLS